MAQPQGEIEDLATALAVMLGSDPLARSPQLLDPTILRDIEGGEAPAAYVEGVLALERGEGEIQRAMQQLEDEWRTTATVALARGYRLRIVENQLANTNGDTEASQALLVDLLTPLNPTAPGDTLPRTPLAWLSREPGRDALVRAYADRWVLEGWLTAPDLPVEVLQPLLEAPQYDGLRKTPTGELVLARAAAGADEAAIAGGLDALAQATELALRRAAADRDREQAAWAERLAATIEQTGDADPIAALHALSGDPTLQRSVALRGGGRATALELQRFYQQRAERWLRETDRVAIDAHGLVERWGWVLDQLASDRDALFGHLDWITKAHLLDEASELSPDARKKIDLRYHELGSGYHAWLEEAGLCPRLAEDADIERATRQPPPDTPAAERGRLVRSLSASNTAASVGWSTVKTGGQIIYLDQARRRRTGGDPASGGD